MRETSIDVTDAVAVAWGRRVAAAGRPQQKQATSTMGDGEAVGLGEGHSTDTGRTPRIESIHSDAHLRECTKDAWDV